MSQRIPIQTMMDVISAAHLAHYVQSPFQSRGGIFLVAPPGAMKSTMLSVLESYPDAIVMTDLNTQSLGHLRESITGGNINTIAISDLQKIYERHASVAMNLEGTIRALIDEGWKGAAFQDARIARLSARCHFIGGMTGDLAEQHFTRWLATGFMRRFMYVLYRLEDPSVLGDSVADWSLLDIQWSPIAPPVGSNKVIPSTLTKAEREKIRKFLRVQHSEAVPFQMLCKMAEVLAWHYKRSGSKKRAMETIEEFSGTLGREGAVVYIDERPKGKGRKTTDESKLSSRSQGKKPAKGIRDGRT